MNSSLISQMVEQYPDNYFIMNPSDYYYMDCGYGNVYGGDSWCGRLSTWKKIYSFSPKEFLKDTSKILGGEGAIWSDNDICIILMVKCGQESPP